MLINPTVGGFYKQGHFPNTILMVSYNASVCHAGPGSSPG